MTVGAIIAAAMSWAIGAQDVSNCFGTAVGSKALTVMQAVMIAAVCEFVGSLTGGDVAATLATGILDMEALDAMGSAGVALYMRCMLATMIGAVAWLVIATVYSLPVSTTHSLVGALIGVGLLATGSAKWATLGGVLSSWVTSPILGCVISYALYARIHRLLQQAASPQAAIRAALPWYYAFTVAAMALFLGLIGPKAHRLTYPQAAVTAALVFGAVFVAVRSPSAAMHAAARALAAPGPAQDGHREPHPRTPASTAPAAPSPPSSGALVAAGPAATELAASGVRGRKRGSQSTAGSDQEDGGPAPAASEPGGGGGQAGDSTHGADSHGGGGGGGVGLGGSGPGGDVSVPGRLGGVRGASAAALDALGGGGGTDSHPPALGMLGAAFGRVVESKRDGGKDVGGSFHRGKGEGEAETDDDGASLIIGARSEGGEGGGAGASLERGGAGATAQRAAEVAEAEGEFVRLLVLTSCVLSFSHGSQDVSNAAAPYAAVVAVAASRQLGAASSTPMWVLAAGGVGIVVGLATYGYKVMATVGTGITKLTYAKGFAAQLATALTALTATLLGLTVSTTHVMIGAIAGVALADGPDKLNLAMLRKIAASWIITLPASAGLAAVGFGILAAADLPTTP